MQHQVGTDDHMKAIVYYNYGPPDVLKYEEIEKPTAGDDQVLVKVRAASVNPLDWHFMRGTPYFVRIMTGLRRPKVTRLGVDVAGQVEAVGRRSEEHTSELQSLRHLVCRLLLEKTQIKWRGQARVSRDTPAAAARGSSPGCDRLAFFFNDAATTEIYPLSLHDALPI